MLQNETPGTSAGDRNADVPVSQRRVTPQELTRALAAIEAKNEEAARCQEEEERYLSGTITIGQSVAELGLESTPEAIWVEVQAQRDQALLHSAQEAPQEAEAAVSRTMPASEARTSAPPHGDVRPANSPRRKAVGAVALACAASILVAFLRTTTTLPRGQIILPPALVRSTATPAIHRSPFAMTAPDAEFYRKLSLSQGPHPQYRIVLGSESEMLPLNEGRPGPTVYPLNAVPDGCTFYKPRFTGSGYGIGSSLSPSCVFAESGPGVASPGWRMTRYSGRYYYRTWIRRADVTRLKRRNGLDLYPNPSVAGGMTPLTLAVASYPPSCEIGDIGGVLDSSTPCLQTVASDSEVRMPEGAKVTLDEHAWEDFTAFPQRNYQPPVWDKEPGFFVADQGFETRGFDASSQVKPLGAVPNGVPVHCSRLTLEQLLHPYTGTSLRAAMASGWSARVLVDARPNLDRPWIVVRLGGRTYLRGWVAARPLRHLLPSRELAIFSSPQAPEFVNTPVQITVPLDTLNWRGGIVGGTPPHPAGPGTVGRVVAVDVHLDDHSWDKW